MTGLNPDGWRVHSNNENRIRLIQTIDKGQLAKRVIQATKSLKNGMWEVEIYESRDGDQKDNVLYDDTFPQASRREIIDELDNYARQYQSH